MGRVSIEAFEAYSFLAYSFLVLSKSKLTDFLDLVH